MRPSLINYCASITLYPFLVDGLNKIWVAQVMPQSIRNRSQEKFINLLFAVAAQFAGAVTPEFLTYFDYFLRKDFGLMITY